MIALACYCYLKEQDQEPNNLQTFYHSLSVDEGVQECSDTFAFMAVGLNSQGISFVSPYDETDRVTFFCWQIRSESESLDMNMTDFERLSLINQYEILKGLHPNRDDHYDPIIKALTDGYLQDFENLACHIEPALGDEVRTEVREIFEMFRALAPGRGAKPHLVFGGYDGNEEGEHYAYASFLLEGLNLWKESQDRDLNSHTDMLSYYRKMLAVWNTWHDKRHPTADEIERIVAVAPPLCKPE